MRTNGHNLKFAVSAGVLLALVVGALLITVVDRDPRQPKLAQSAENAEQSFVAASVKPTLTARVIFRESINGNELEIGSPAEVEAFAILLRRLINDSASKSLDKQWLEYGWVLHRDAMEDCIFIAEHPSRRVGRGLYAIRTANAYPIMIQSPHRFHDQKTGVIARKLFESQPVIASAWNTIHRSKYDVAHADGSYFNAFTRVVVDQFPETVNYQLHGFDNSKATSGINDRKSALAIVSNASRFPTADTKSIASKLKLLWGSDRVWLFPLETGDLGATTNTQAAVMRKQGSQNFIHVEMAKELRETLVNSAVARDRFFQAMESACSSNEIPAGRADE